jgi:elongation factor G
MSFPTLPLVSQIFTPKASEDMERLRLALIEIASFDPTFFIDTGSTTASFIVGGLSESHLESIRDRLFDPYGIAIDASMPAVVYVETIRESAHGEGKYIRQIGGTGNYGHCKLLIEPNTRNRGCEILSVIEGGVLSENFVRAIEHGIRGELKTGGRAGRPLVDVRVTLYDGSFHETDSNEMAFKIAGSFALKEAIRKASQALLEPMMAVEVDLPVELIEPFIAEIKSRRGRIDEVEEHSDGWQVIHAIVPLAEVLGSTSGRFPDDAMNFVGYEEVPDDKLPGADGSEVPVNSPKSPWRSRGSAAADHYPESE